MRLPRGWHNEIWIGLAVLMSGCAFFDRPTVVYLPDSSKPTIVKSGGSIAATEDMICMGTGAYYRIFQDCAAAIVPAP